MVACFDTTVQLPRYFARFLPSKIKVESLQMLPINEVRFRVALRSCTDANYVNHETCPTASASFDASLSNRAAFQSQHNYST